MMNIYSINYELEFELDFHNFTFTELEIANSHIAFPKSIKLSTTELKMSLLFS